MSFGLRRRWQQRSVKRCLCCGALLSFPIVGAAGQQSDQLQHQLQELKREYETTSPNLEQRIAALQEQIDKEKRGTE